MRTFQNLGHKVILIVGDYTATVGDPSGKNKTRPILSHEEVLEHSKTYQEQFFKIVDKNKTEVVYNGDWFKTMSFKEVTQLVSNITVAQMLEREDFQNRYKAGQPIRLHEFLYPMMQGFDSVKIQADIELGGTDQRFNVIRGRDLQKAHHQEPQVGLFMPILIGTDGVQKMSKSLNNTVGISEPAQSIYHKLYNLPDDLIESYFTLLTEVPENELQQKMKDMKQGKVSPPALKNELAQNIVSQYYNPKIAQETAMNEKKIHSGDTLPEDIPTITVKKGEHWLSSLLVTCNFVKSNGEGRRMIQNGGVTFDNQKQTDVKSNVNIQSEHLLKMGKRNFCKIVVE